LETLLEEVKLKNKNKIGKNSPDNGNYSNFRKVKKNKNKGMLDVSDGVRSILQNDKKIFLPKIID